MVAEVRRPLPGTKVIYVGLQHLACTIDSVDGRIATLTPKGGVGVFGGLVTAQVPFTMDLDSGLVIHVKDYQVCGQFGQRYAYTMTAWAKAE